MGWLQSWVSTLATAPVHEPDRFYARRFLGIAGIVLGLTAALNVGVDPYDLYGLNRFGIFIGAEREAKQRWIQTRPHDAVLMGSSKLDFVDPRTLEAFDFFNASMGGVQPEEMEEFIRLHVHDVEGVIIGFDFFMFNQTCFPLRPSIRLTWEDYVFRYPLNLKSLEYCWHTVRKGLLGRPPVVLPWGQMNPAKTEEKDATSEVIDYSEGIPYLEENHYRDYRFSEVRLDRLRQLRRTLADREIPYVAILNPMNEAVRARIRERADLEPMFQRFKTELHQIFPDLIDLSESVYSDKHGFYKLDPLHFKPETGTRFLNEEVIPELRTRRHELD